MLVYPQSNLLLCNMFSWQCHNGDVYWSDFRWYEFAKEFAGSLILSILQSLHHMYLSPFIWESSPPVTDTLIILMDINFKQKCLLNFVYRMESKQWLWCKNCIEVQPRYLRNSDFRKICICTGKENTMCSLITAEAFLLFMRSRQISSYKA